MLHEYTDIAVIGGGISGLSAAHRLATLARAPTTGEEPRITLLEADERLGGKLRTERIAGRPLDVGAEALLARVPGAIELCRELGLEDELVAPLTDQAYIWTDALHPLPPRLLAGLPGGAGRMISSRILSPAGLARAALDLIAPSRGIEADISIGSLVRRRLGDQALERLIDPLLGGIHAGNCDQLSVQSTAPQLAAAVATGRGLVRGLRLAAPKPSGGPPPPMFLTLRGGLGRLVEALRAQLEGVECLTGSRVAELQALGGGAWRLRLEDGSTLEAAQVILAVPAYAAAELLGEAAPAAAGELARVEYASVATVSLSYPAGALAAAPAGSGFLVQRGRERTMTACTLSSNKWPHLAGRTALLKCSVGCAGERSALELDDQALLARVRAELREVLGIEGPAESAAVHRFERALPQYTVGHAARIRRVESELARLPGLRLCGAAYHGVGVPACIRDGQGAAAAAWAELPIGGRPERLSGSRPAHLSN